MYISDLVLPSCATYHTCGERETERQRERDEEEREGGGVGGGTKRWARGR